MRVNRSMVLMVVACIASLVATVVLVQVSRDWEGPSPIAGDPGLYRVIADGILEGELPYIDRTVEHLPVLLVPIVALGALDTVSIADFAGAWPVLVIFALLVAVFVAGRITVSDDYQWRFTVAVTPMVPLILYRLEVFVLLLALAAIADFAVDRHRRGTMWAAVGALAKGWPLVLLAVPWRRGAPRVAAIGAALTISVLAIVGISPGFRAGRGFTGVHTETLAGNLTLVVRHLTGADLGVVPVAGAFYVEVPWLIVLLNGVVGLALFGVAVRAATRTTGIPHLIRACGLATLGIILMSPLLSAQFIVWLAPFVPLLSGRARALAFAVAATSTMVVAFWDPLQAWWAAGVAVRNILLVALAIVWALEVLRRSPASGQPVPVSTSRRNLPV